MTRRVLGQVVPLFALVVLWAVWLPVYAAPGLTLSPSNPAVLKGLGLDFKALFGAKGEDKTASVKAWNSSNAAIAAIDSSGHAVALNPGTTVISAVFGNQTAATTLTVITVANPIFSVQPSATPVNAAITPAVQVLIRDNRGLPLAGLTVTMSIGTNGGQGGAGVLGGTLSHTTDAQGIASFANLSLDWLGAGYTLVATVNTPTGPLAATSDPFEVTREGEGCLGPTPACDPHSQCSDKDGDGLNDAWEMGGGVDLNGDGLVTDAQHDLLLADADPSKPDVYVLYDWMDYGLDYGTCVTDANCNARGLGHRGETCGGETSQYPGQCTYACTTDSDCTTRWPMAVHGSELCIQNACQHTHDPLALEPEAFDLVAARFAAHGINLHVIRGQARPHSVVVAFRSDTEMTISCEGATGGNVGVGKYAVSLYDLKPEEASPLAYHYALFSHYSMCDSQAHCLSCPTAGQEFGQTGIAEPSGNDMMVSLGGLVNNSGVFPHFAQPSAFMHELGHTLGLRHDGHLDRACSSNNDCSVGDICVDLFDGQGPACHETVGGWLNQEEPNYKPNYLSIMNYRYQRGGIGVGNSLGSRVARECDTDSECEDDGGMCLPSLSSEALGNHCSASYRTCQTSADCPLAGESCLAPEPRPKRCSRSAYSCESDLDCNLDESCVAPSKSGSCARLDYSRQTLPVGGPTPGALDEANLDDTVGLGSGTTDIFTHMDGRCSTGWKPAPTTGPVNWTGEGVLVFPSGGLVRFGPESFTDTGVQADIDALDHTFCDPANARDILHGHTDWPDLSGIPFNYKFQCTDWGQR